VERSLDIGPKAAVLARLAEAGLPVPESRFLGAGAYREHAARAGVSALLPQAGDGLVDPGRVRRAIVSTPLDAALVGELRVWHRDLGGRSLAVRSSGSAEDLPGASFAGQHGTYFVRDTDQLVERVRDCWASLFSDRAVAYREHAGIPHTDVAMAVIVQPLVAAEAAGVAFTANPMDPGDGAVWIEACLGIGEALVSGKVTPDRLVFERDGLSLRSVAPGDKPVLITNDGSGSATQRKVPAETATAMCIDEDTGREVARLALAAEDLLGGPLDVEWAFDGARVWLLQARPITVASDAAVTPGKSAAPSSPVAAVRGATIWSNVNTGEILPDVASPMTWSIIHGRAQDIFGAMFDAFGVHVDAQKVIGLVGGRIYFNLSMLRDSFSTIPGMNVDVALGGMHDYVEVPPVEPARGPGRLAMARAALAMPVYVYRHTPKKAMRFARFMRVTTDASLRAIAQRPDAAAALRLVRSLNEEFSRFNDALAFMAVAMFGFGLLGGITGRWLGDKSGALANRLVAGSGEVASADAGHALWRLAGLARESTHTQSAVLCGCGWDDVRDRLDAAALAGDEHAHAFISAWDAFMAEHGHHRRGELEFANPSWAERPDYVLGVVRGYLTHETEEDPVAAYARRAAEADEAAADASARLRNPLKRAVFGRVLGWGRASARTRETIKSEAVRWLVAIRRALLLYGGRLAEQGVLERADDVFFLEYGELERALGDGGEWHGVVAGRRAEHERLEALAPPPVVVGHWDESSGPWSVSSDARTLKGISVSAGVARGRARVFLSADAEEEVLPGEILVAPSTDPGWTPYFIPAAGIVMDMGGLLSHGSIIAREYGIPAVVNVGPATRIISTGDLVEVDGDNGVVRILG
jgi:phosphohistidine swiveling domain-containing protein